MRSFRNMRCGRRWCSASVPSSTRTSRTRTIGATEPKADGPELGSGDGDELQPLQLPQYFWVVVLLPRGGAKTCTADVYAAFDERNGNTYHVNLLAERRAMDRVAQPVPID